MQFLFNFEDQTTLSALLGYFPKSTAVDIAVGYLDAGGLQFITKSVQELLDKGGRFRLIAGMHGEGGNRVTFEELKLLWNLNNYKRGSNNEERIKLGISRSYHGKLYLFKTTKGYRIIIGSSNLSRPGLQTRWEANVVIENEVQDDNILQCENAFEAIWNESAYLSGQSIKVISLPKAPEVQEVEHAKSFLSIEDPSIPEARISAPYIFTISENNLNEGGRPRIDEAYLNAGKEANEFFGTVGEEKRNKILQVITDDNYSFQINITGYGDDRSIGKNVRSTPSNKDMGTWLKSRKNARPGDKVCAYKIQGKEDTFLFEFVRS